LPWHDLEAYRPLTSPNHVKIITKLETTIPRRIKSRKYARIIEEIAVIPLNLDIAGGLASLNLLVISLGFALFTSRKRQGV
jgi:hypothetical protein